MATSDPTTAPPLALTGEERRIITEMKQTYILSSRLPSNPQDVRERYHADAATLRALLARAEGVREERARTEMLADHLIGWCAAVDEDASWDSWDSWFKDAAFPRGTTPFDVLMCEHYRRVADADSPHAAYAEQQLERMSRAAAPEGGDVPSGNNNQEDTMSQDPKSVGAGRPVTDEQLDQWFTHHPPAGEQLRMYQAVREAGKAFATVVRDACPPGADATTAIRKIREAVMTANAAIACEGR